MVPKRHTTIVITSYFDYTVHLQHVGACICVVAIGYKTAESKIPRQHATILLITYLSRIMMGMIIGWYFRRYVVERAGHCRMNETAVMGQPGVVHSGGFKEKGLVSH